MRRAHFLAPLWLAALAASSPAAHAQAHDGHHPPAAESTSGTAGPSVRLAGAIDPAADSLPLRHPALPASGAIATELTDWRQANAAVAEFPKGHMDILRWESAQAGRPAAAPAAHGPHQPRGGRP